MNNQKWIYIYKAGHIPNNQIALIKTDPQELMDHFKSQFKRLNVQKTECNDYEEVWLIYAI